MPQTTVKAKPVEKSPDWELFNGKNWICSSIQTAAPDGLDAQKAHGPAKRLVQEGGAVAVGAQQVQQGLAQRGLAGDVEGLAGGKEGEVLQRLQVHAHDRAKKKAARVACGKVPQRAHDAYQEGRAAQARVTGGGAGEHEAGS